jgi:hypothetical protein
VRDIAVVYFLNIGITFKKHFKISLKREIVLPQIKIRYALSDSTGYNDAAVS